MKKKQVVDAVEYREIVVRHAHPPFSKALISLDKGVENLTAFKQLCSTALGIKVETVCDEQGTRLSDLRQVWPRGAVVALQKGESWTPTTSKLPKLLAHNCVLSVAAVLFILLYGYLAALCGARWFCAAQAHLPCDKVQLATQGVSRVSPAAAVVSVNEPLEGEFAAAVAGRDAALEPSAGLNVPRNVEGGSSHSERKGERGWSAGVDPSFVAPAEQEQSPMYTCKDAADASLDDEEYAPVAIYQGNKQALTESGSVSTATTHKTSELGTSDSAPPAAAASAPRADLTTGDIDRDKTTLLAQQDPAAWDANGKSSWMREMAENAEQAGATGREASLRDKSAATRRDASQDNSESTTKHNNNGDLSAHNNSSNNNINNNSNNRSDNGVDGGPALGMSAASWEESDATSTHPQGMKIAPGLDRSEMDQPMAGNRSAAEAGANATGYVLVERRRHKWGSDNLFSWAVIGSAMRKLGLQEALQPDLEQEGSRKDDAQAHWDMLLCLTEECSGVDIWRWPDSFSTLAPGQLFNHFPGITELSGRERLFRNLAAMVARFGSEFDIMPETYLLREEAAAFHTALRATQRSAAGATVSSKPAIWIFKNLSVPIGSQVVFGQGKHLISADTPDKIPTSGQFLTQRYVADPLLLHGRKFTLRLYLLLTSVNPVRLYMYDEGLAHFAVDRYSSLPASLTNSYAHITNEALAARHDEMTPPLHSKQGAGASGSGPSGRASRESRRAAAAEVRKHRCVMTLRELRAALLKAGMSVDALWRKIEGIAIKAVLSAEERLVQYSESLLHGGGRVFELLAMDVLLDRQMRPWLLKITDTVPNLQADTNLKFAMKEQMVLDMFRMVGAVQQQQHTDEVVFGKKIAAMTARWGLPSHSNIQMLKEFEMELQMRGSYTLLQPSVQEGEVNWKRYFTRPNDLMLRRWIELDSWSG